MTSLYIHIPFCKGKCLYCDFTSGTDLSKEKAYLQALKMEMAVYQETLSEDSIETIYIGGGTPSVLSMEALDDLFTSVHATFNLTKLKEWSMEVNPESAKNLDFDHLKNLGLSRVSMGIQSLNSHHLNTLGRIHNLEDVYQSLEKIRQGGIEEVNGDFIFSFPGQTLKSLEEDLSGIKSLGLTHLSYYSFIPEEGTYLGERVLNNELGVPSEEEDRAFSHRIEEELASLGYRQYEISNFTRTKACFHNLAYWRVKDYLGLGISAHSSLGDFRQANTQSLQEYIDKLNMGQPPIVFKEEIRPKDRVLEYIILGLRLNEGIDSSKIYKRFGLNFQKTFSWSLEKNLEANTLIEQEGKYSLTSYGRDVANQVELDFYRTDFELG